MQEPKKRQRNRDTIFLIIMAIIFAVIWWKYLQPEIPCAHYRQDQLEEVPERCWYVNTK